MNPLTIFQLVVTVITEAPALVADVEKVISLIQNFGKAVPNPAPEHLAAVVAAAKAASQAS